MQTPAHYYFALLGCVVMAPLVMMMAGIFKTLRMSRHKWMVHVITFCAMVFALPAAIWIGGVLDPTTIEYPGPGEGFAALAYVFCLMPCALLYSVYAWCTRTKSHAGASAP